MKFWYDYPREAQDALFEALFALAFLARERPVKLPKRFLA